jgi:hypothetical protein
VRIVGWCHTAHFSLPAGRAPNLPLPVVRSTERCRESTGGARLYGFGHRAAQKSCPRLDGPQRRTFKLKSGGYQWNLLPALGKTFTHSGIRCPPLMMAHRDVSWSDGTAYPLWSCKHRRDVLVPRDYGGRKPL